MANLNVERKPQSGERRFEFASIQDYYDNVDYGGAAVSREIPAHYRRHARRFRLWRGKKLLDIAGGVGLWLRPAADLRAIPAGIDISPLALDVCKASLPTAELLCAPAERLPFTDGRFDFISCLGALEHFLEHETALREMIRVAKPNADFFLLVPNADFLTRRLGLFAGTRQVEVREEVRSLEEWQRLFESVGLRIEKRWRDLHVVSWSWIMRGPKHLRPMRAAQALALPFWPLSWQYQVYQLCTPKR
jgi:ubiquinone/menaquinone biosynthesis C-methylase UbiE